MASAVHQGGSIASETPLRVGFSTILASGNTVAVPDTNITATSVVVCWGIGVADARVLTFSVDNIVAGVGFNLSGGFPSYTSGATTIPAQTLAANKSVGYAVLRY
jgi:hypothetical protein